MPDAAPSRRFPAHVLARAATFAIFFLNGFVFASWVLHIPTVRDRLGLSPGVLGLVLLAIAIGSLVAMPLAGQWIARIGSRPPTRLLAVLNPLSLVPPLLSPDLPTLAVSLFVYGAITGALDVSMNAQGVAVERRTARPILSSFHAGFSLGGLVGAALGGVLLGLGLTPVAHVVAVSGLFTLVAAVAGTVLLGKDADDTGSAAESSARGRPLSPIVLLLGALGFLGLMGEGAVADWSAIYYRDVLEVSAAQAGLGFTIFSLTMTVGRFFGDRWRVVFGDRRLLTAGGAIAAGGLGAALLSSDPWLAALGFGAFGLGFANIVPVLFSAAGREGDAGRAIAQVSTLAYLGFLAGPPLIGFVAEVTSLRVGLLIVAGSAAVIALLARPALALPAPASELTTEHAR